MADINEFVSVAKKLKTNNIPFYITGSFAVALYTKKRVPNDFDIVVKVEDLDRIEDAFEVSRVRGKTLKNEEYCVIHIGKVEVSLCDVYYHNNRLFSLAFEGEKYKKYRTFRIDEIDVKVIDPEELVILKLIQDRNSEFKQDRKDALLLLHSDEINVSKLIKYALKYRVFGKLVSLYLSTVSPISTLLKI